MAFALLLTACPMAIEEEATPTPATEVLGGTPGAGDLATPATTEAVPTCYQPTPEGGLVDGTPVDPSERLRPPTPGPTPEPFEPLPFEQDASLEEQLRQLLGEQVDSYAVVAKSVTEGPSQVAGAGRGVAINGDKTFYAASLFKVSIMFEVFHQRSLGVLSFDEDLLVTPYYARFDLGTLAVQVCDTVSIGEALAAMMSVSDNASAVLLQDRVGAANVNRAMEALGLSTTRLLEEDLPVTASDMALLLEAIARGEAVDGEASGEMVRLLGSEKSDNGLRAGLPEGTLAGHKTGNWTNATHDAGIVYSPAATYVIVMLSDKGYDAEDAVPLADISRAVWEYYSKIGGGNEER